MEVGSETARFLLLASQTMLSSMPLMNMQWPGGSFSQGVPREWDPSKDGFGTGMGVFGCAPLD